MDNIFSDNRQRKPRRHCRGIMPQFVDKILSGEKTTTIRSDAKNMRAGDLISFWVGWRKKNPTYICTVEIVEEPNEINIQLYLKERVVLLYGEKFSWEDDIFRQGIVPFTGFNEGDEYLEKLAKADGFDSFREMYDFFFNTYPKSNRIVGGLEWEFVGKLITFGNVRVETERYNKNNV